MFYISKTKAAFNPANTNTPDTFVSRGYDTREEAAEALEVIEAINTMLAEKSNLCIIEHDQNKIGAQHPNNCKEYVLPSNFYENGKQTPYFGVPTTRYAKRKFANWPELWHNTKANYYCYNGACTFPFLLWISK